MLQNLMRMMRKDKKGFTLVELMIVVVIIGILIAIAIPVYRSIEANAKKRACQANQRSIKSQLEVYKADEATGSDAGRGGGLGSRVNDARRRSRVQGRRSKVESPRSKV